jgi:hypothetical protein
MRLRTTACCVLLTLFVRIYGEFSLQSRGALPHYVIFFGPSRVARHKSKRSGTDGPVCGGHWVAEPFQASLHAALADLAKWLEAARIPAMIIGGVAASALGRPRLTQDIDALAIVPETDWANVVESAAQ